MNENTITNRYENLQETIKFFEDLIYTSTDGIVVTDTTQNIILANDAFCNIFDKSRREMKETNLLLWLEQLDTGTVNKWVALENEIFLNGFCHNVELQRTRVPGRKMYFNINASRMVQTAFSDAYVTVSIWHDITERIRNKKRMEELNESLERRVFERTEELTGLYEKLHSETTERKLSEERIASIAHILDESLNEIYIFDIETLRFIQVNKSARQNLGYSMEELGNLTPLDIKRELTAGSFMDIVESLRSGETEKKQFRTVHRRKDGSLYNVEVHLQLSTFQSVPVFVAIILDITERMKMEGALLQSEKLKAIGVVASGISHEINNVFSIIMGRAEILNGGVKDDSELERGLSSIIKASENGAAIVNKMLAFAKSEAKTSNYKFIDISLLIKDAIDFTEPRWKNMAQSKGVNYQINTEGAEGVYEVFCNPTELTEVFINTINNALDAMPDGGCIALRLKSDERTLFISISDTGTGISEEVKKKIFDPFFTTRLPQGTGLGLSIVYSIIKRHDGKIEVESEAGKGATFNISIPISREMEQNIASPSKQKNDKITKKLRILVVDDETDMSEILDDFFTSEGHVVKTVGNCAEAIELFRKEQFDLVLSDLVMPGKTGYDVVKALYELERRPKIGIITGWSEDLNSLEKEELKVDFIIKKPLRLSEIAKHVNVAFAIND